MIDDRDPIDPDDDLDERDFDDDDEVPEPTVTVEITGLSLYTQHGVSEAERELGQRLVIDVAFELADCDAMVTDRIEDTVDYGALALRLASFQLLRADGVDPVLVLDDVFAELDTARRAGLARWVADAEQVIVTAAVPADVPDMLAGTQLVVETGSVGSTVGSSLAGRAPHSTAAADGGS